MPAISRENEGRLSADQLRSILDYDLETGLLRWRGVHPNAQEGGLAGYVRRDGRRVIKIGYTRYLASRLAWLYVHGEWPEKYIDHIDRNQSNDAISNLRPADSRQNHWNSGVRKNKQLGLRNIVKHKKRFVVRFFQDRKAIYRESFLSLDEAVRARDAQYPLICGAFAPSSPDQIGGQFG